MRRHSDAYPLVLLGAVFVLTWLFKSIFEDAFKAWTTRYIEAAFGPGAAAALMGGFVEIVPTLGLAIIVVWLLQRYIHLEYSARKLAFVRELQGPEGDFGYYTAFVTVENTSATTKLQNCRCEIVELRDELGALIEKNIGLRTRGQENKEVQGRFYLDQAASKEVPIFRIDQSKEDGLQVVNANDWDITLEHGIYSATIRGYGDTGEPDEMTIKLDSRNCEFIVVDKLATRSEGPSRRVAKDASQSQIELSAELALSQEGLFPAKYVQVSVRAIGNLTGCQIMLTEVAKVDGDKAEVVYNHPQNAGWSGSNERMIDINDDQEQRANLFSVSRNIPTESYVLVPRTHHPDQRLRLAVSPPAQYRLTIQASSKTSAPQTRQFTLRWGGTIEDVYFQ